MTDSKPIWASRTFWTNVVGGIALIASAAGLDLGLDAETQTALIGGALATANLILRLVTSKSVTLSGSGSIAPSVLLGAILLGAVACTTAPDRADFESDEAYQQAVEEWKTDRASRRAIARQFAIDRIRAANQLGILYVKADPKLLFAVDTACGTAMTIVTVVDVTVPDLPDTLVDFCNTVSEAILAASQKEASQ